MGLSALSQKSYALAIEFAVSFVRTIIGNPLNKGAWPKHLASFRPDDPIVPAVPEILISRKF
jgi:hypothetical protein